MKAGKEKPGFKLKLFLMISDTREGLGKLFSLFSRTTFSWNILEKEKNEKKKKKEYGFLSSDSPWAYLHFWPPVQLPFKKAVQMAVLKNSVVDLSSDSPCAKEQLNPNWHFPILNNWQSLVFFKLGGRRISCWEWA